jgi:hypothetical protein
VDNQTKAITEYHARIIFVNAACLNTNLILLNSQSARFPQGLGNDNGLLGHYIAFHNYRGNVSAGFDGFPNSYYYGRRPTEVFIPSFRNLHKHEGLGFQRGYMSYFGAVRADWGQGIDTPGIGGAWKDSITEPGPWFVYMGMQGEPIPKFENHVRLSPDQKDEWGIPQLITSIAYDDNDDKMAADFITQGSEMLEAAGCKNISGQNNHQNPGLDIHEIGGVRMGKDPKTSLLNEWNQLHACKNVFVTDGACMTSTGNQNPSPHLHGPHSPRRQPRHRRTKKTKPVNNHLFSTSRVISMTLPTPSCANPATPKLVRLLHNSRPVHPQIPKIPIRPIPYPKPRQMPAGMHKRRHHQRRRLIPIDKNLDLIFGHHDLRMQPIGGIGYRLDPLLILIMKFLP